MTITLAVGVQAMAQRQAVVRRMHAVETLGSVDTICSDKTGTLTRNEMVVATVVASDGTVQVSGTGYAPEGRLERAGQLIHPANNPLLLMLARAGLLCNDAIIEQDDRGDWRLEGDPTEGALVALAGKLGLTRTDENAKSQRLDAIPFDSEARYMATLHAGGNGGQRTIFVKGAPERIIDMCTREVSTTGSQAINRAVWRERAEVIAADGQRVLAIARISVGADHARIEPGDVATNLELLGLVGLIDPPREEVITAVADCQRAGIRVKMITGDHGTTASAVAAQIGIGDGRTVLSGAEIDNLNDNQLLAQAKRVDIFARVSPDHKLRLVQALQADGEVVAMTGDGVNDAAALKRADVGVAMGNKGTEVAREAAEIVLTDDNFASIVAAVRLGRTAYDNIKRSVVFLLPTNGGEGLAIMAAIFVGMQLPITPVQILWINMITAATLGLSLAFEPVVADVMRRAPRPPDEPVVSGYLVRRILIVAVIMLIGTFGFFGALRMNGIDLALARTAAVNALVFFEVFYLFNARLLNQPLRRVRDLTGNWVAWASVAAVVVLQLAFTYNPWMQLLFDSAAMPAWYWAVLIPLTASVMVLVELEKVFLPGSRPSALDS